jgi:hypothetical protein
LAAYDAVLKDALATKSGSPRPVADLPEGAWLNALVFTEARDTEDDDSAVDEALADQWLYDWPAL